MTVIAPQEKREQKTDGDLWEEYRVLGFLRNIHPLALWKDDVLAVKYRVKALRIGETECVRSVCVVVCGGNVEGIHIILPYPLSLIYIIINATLNYDKETTLYMAALSKPMVT